MICGSERMGPTTPAANTTLSSNRFHGERAGYGSRDFDIRLRRWRGGRGWRDMAISGNIKMLATIGDTCKPINIPINGASRPNTPPHTNAFLLLFNIPKLYHRVLPVRFL